MAKVIYLQSRCEIDSLPFDKEQAEKLIEHIMEFQATESTADSFAFMFENTIRYILNNSGADMEKIHERIMENRKKAERA